MHVNNSGEYEFPDNITNFDGPLVYGVRNNQNAIYILFIFLTNLSVLVLMNVYCFKNLNNYHIFSNIGTLE